MEIALKWWLSFMQSVAFLNNRDLSIMLKNIYLNFSQNKPLLMKKSQAIIRREFVTKKAEANRESGRFKKR